MFDQGDIIVHVSEHHDHTTGTGENLYLGNSFQYDVLNVIQRRNVPYFCHISRNGRLQRTTLEGKPGRLRQPFR